MNRKGEIKGKNEGGGNKISKGKNEGNEQTM